MSPEPLRFGGLDVVIVPERLVPKIQLSEPYPGTEAFKVKMNRWLADFFGYRKVCMLPPGEVLIAARQRTIYMRAETWEKLKQHCGVWKWPER